MKTLKFLTIITLVIFITSCSKKDDAKVEISESSYDFQFASGTLSQKQYKAGKLTAEEAVAIYTEEPTLNIKGISTQLQKGDFFVGGYIILDGNNAQPLSNEEGAGTVLVLTLTEGGVNYVYSSKSGNVTLKNLSYKTGATNGSLVSYELSFENATFIDEVAKSDNRDVEVKLNGKIVVK